MTKLKYKSVKESEKPKNLILGEWSNFPELNSNILDEKIEIPIILFKLFFEFVFPFYEVKVREKENTDSIYILEDIYEKENIDSKITINDIYICFKEADYKNVGLLFHLKDGHAYILKEKAHDRKTIPRIKLLQKGSYWGSRGNKTLSNLKVGEYRYYIQDNPNIISSPLYIYSYIWRLDAELFKLLFEFIFEEYHIKLEKIFDKDGVKGVYEKNDRLIVDNKGYICFREAKHGKPGLLLYFQDGYYVFIYKEQYKRKKS